MPPKLHKGAAVLLPALSSKLYLEKTVLERLHGLRLIRGSEAGLAGCAWRLEASRLGLFVSRSSAMVVPTVDNLLLVGARPSFTLG
jgi:hypothetical protein